jgi:gliding motility-associated-like protein
MLRARFIIFLICLLSIPALLALGFISKRAISPIVKKKPVAAFDCPALDNKNVVVSPSDCDVNNGSIIGLQGTGTGTLVYTWYNSNSQVVGTDADLTGMPPGFYYVKLRDDSKCAPATLQYTIGQNNPVSIDNSQTIISSPTCNAVNGSITNVTVNNAIKLKWTDAATNANLTTNKDLLNVGPGTYILTASNAKGCIAQYRYTVNPGNYAPVMTAYTTANSDCGNTGVFKATFDMKPTDPTYTYQITDANDKVYFSGSLAYTPGDSTRITIPAPYPPGAPPLPPNPGLPAGTYTLTTLGGGNCFTKLVTFTIGSDIFTLDTSKLVIKPNVCGLYNGSISGIFVKGGPSPYPKKIYPEPTEGFFWKDDSGHIIPQATSYIAGVPSGWYSLYAVNYDHCTTPTIKFFLPDSVSTASVPVLKDAKLCLPAKTSFSVQNRDYKARYRLYDTAHNLIDTNYTGFFIRTVNTTTSFFVVSVNGICESPAGKVTVTVEAPGVTVPNTFTPNNDGINDIWGVSGLGQYPGTEVSVFNRSGYRVYHSIDYSSPFDGRINGAALPSGTYYYIIDTKKPGCTGGITGSLTIIR